MEGRILSFSKSGHRKMASSDISPKTRSSCQIYNLDKKIREINDSNSMRFQHFRFDRLKSEVIEENENFSKSCDMMGGNTADSVVSQEIRDVISYEAAYSFAELSMLIILLSDDYGGSGKTHYGGNSVTATIIMASPE
ncbi:unnamed protein product [Nesidiocoris tenuis]|uniref:Uncharacterized protein n=1 Tax=Nesidiocoris tenuis TaxID=355587 RepID=A0A6H5GH68_9HEMI|nr:unnamed protein product [Nesidiocoris tenuis]